MRILHLLPLLLSLPLAVAFLPPLPQQRPSPTPRWAPSQSGGAQGGPTPLGHTARYRPPQSAGPQPRDGATGLLAKEGDGRWDAAGSANKGRIRFRAQGGAGGGAAGSSGGALGLVTEGGQGGGEVAVGEDRVLVEERADVRFQGFGKRDDVAAAEPGEGSFPSLVLSSLELSDTKVCGP